MKKYLGVSFLIGVFLVGCSEFSQFFGVGDDSSDTIPSTYTVSYDGNGSDGGTVPTDSNNYEENTEVTVEAVGTMTKAGYNFIGWNTAENGSGTSRAAGSTFTMGTENVLLYAQWTQNPTYTVTYNGNGYDGGTVPTDSNNYEENTEVTVKAAGTMTKAGYNFIGWNTAENGSGPSRAAGATFTMGTENVTLYAQWGSIVYFGSYRMVDVNNMCQLWAVNLDGSNEHRISPEDSIYHRGAGGLDKSPTAPVIAYAKCKSSATVGPNYLSVMNLETYEETDIITCGDDERIGDVEWNSDGTKIMYILSDGGNPDARDGDVYYCDADGSNNIQVTTSWGYNKLFAAWAPGNKAVYSMCANTFYADPFNIHQIDLDGTNNAQVLSCETTSIDQIWEGFCVNNTVVYQHDYDSSPYKEEIWKVNLDGTGGVLLHSFSEKIYNSIRKTSDGNYALYTDKDAQGYRQIFRITITDLLNGDFSNIEQITTVQESASINSHRQPTM